MLFSSSSNHGFQTCFTHPLSLEIACGTILSGKVKVAGGFDDFSKEGSYEFANMGAMSNSHTEFSMGREPNEMSRPQQAEAYSVTYTFNNLLLRRLDHSIFMDQERCIAKYYEHG